MIKVLFSNGVFVPMEGLPFDLAPDSELIIEIKEVVKEPTVEEIEQWWKELDESEGWLSEAESDRLQAWLTESRRLGKEYMRGANGLRGSLRT